MTDLRHKVVLLNGANYHTWFPEMKAVLRAKKLWTVTHTDVEDPDLETVDQAIGLITLALSPTIRPVFEAHETARELWTAIEQRYAQRSNVRRTTLKEQLNTMRMEPEESIDEFVSRIRQVTAELQSTGYTVQETDT